MSMWAARTAGRAVPNRPRPGVRPGPFAGARFAPRQRRPDLALSDGLSLRDVEWNVLFVGFLVFIFAIVTYWLPVGDAGILIALLALPFQPRGLRFPAAVFWFLLFMIWAAIGSTASPYGASAFNALIDLAKLWIIMLVGTNALRTRRQIQFFIIFVLFFYAGFPARGALYNYFIAHETHFGRVHWNYIYSNSNDLAALTLLQIGLAGAVLVGERRKLFRIGAAAALIVLPVIVLMTQSRGALLGLLMLGVLTLPGQRRKLRTLGLAVTFGLIVFTIAPKDVWERASGLLEVESTDDLAKADWEGSAESRYAILTVAVDIIKAKPVAGTGLGTYQSAHADYAARRILPGGAQGPRDTHNTYLNIAAETGVPGLILFLCMLGSVIARTERTRRRLKRRRHPDANALWFLELGFLAYCVAGMFGTYGKLSHFYLYLVLLLVFAMAAEKQLGAVPATNRARRFASRMASMRRGVQRGAGTAAASRGVTAPRTSGPGASPA